MPRIAIPEDWTREEWYGFTRRRFKFEGYDAWVVEPKYPAGDGRWSWCTVWPEAFVKRVGIVALLEHGFYHVHIDVFTLKANPEGIGVMRRFHDMLHGMGLSEKVNLIGMSWGGFFSLRYAAENPDKIAAIYLDAPLCNISDPTMREKTERQRIIQDLSEAYNSDIEALAASKFNPINNIEPIVKAGIPLFAAMGEADMTLPCQYHIDLLEKRIKELGGDIKVIRRPYWGHHPHGLDDVEPLLEFHCSAR